MNYSLLPEQEQIRMHSEYRIRMIVVLVVMLSIAGAVGIVSLFPAYVHGLSFSITAPSNATSTVPDATYNGMKKELSETAAVLFKLQNSINAPLPSASIGSILDLKQNIKINSVSFAYEHDDAAATVILIVRGVAPTRDALLAFRDRISDMPHTTVTLPLSELTKSTNVSFSLSVVQTIKP